MKPICAPCSKPMVVAKTGITVCTTAEFGPYELWRAELWLCQQCGHKVVSGFSQRPAAMHFEPHFQAELVKARKMKPVGEYYEI